MTEAKTSDVLEALMAYLRFKRQWFCVDECWHCDVLAVTNKGMLEIEIKVSKSDLIQGEKRKNKHRLFKNLTSYMKRNKANKYALCVPEYLQEAAEDWIKETNPNYGLFLYRDGIPHGRGAEDYIWCRKTPKLLHDEQPIKLLEAMTMRASSSIIGKLQKIGRLNEKVKRLQKDS